MKTFKKHLADFFQALPIAIVISCISVITLMYIDFFKEIDLFKFSLSFGITVLIMTHLVRPFVRLFAKEVN